MKNNGITCNHYEILIEIQSKAGAQDNQRRPELNYVLSSIRRMTETSFESILAIFGYTRQIPVDYYNNHK